MLFRPSNFGELQETIAMILCTSGTTGLPKGVRVSHAMALAGLRNLWPIQPGQVSFNTSSLYWLTCFVSISLSIISRSPRIITVQPITPNLILDILEKYEVTYMFTMYAYIIPLMKCLDSRKCDLSKLELVGCAGGLLSQHTRELFKNHLPNVKLLVAYGMTDVGGGIALTFPENSTDSVGILGPGIQAKVNCSVVLYFMHFFFLILFICIGG